MFKTFALVVALVAVSAVPSVAKDGVVKAKSWCPMTNASGIGEGSDFRAASFYAVAKCKSNGGLSGCCEKFVKKI
jgi:hypothetical protein